MGGAPQYAQPAQQYAQQQYAPQQHAPPQYTDNDARAASVSGARVRELEAEVARLRRAPAPAREVSFAGADTVSEWSDDEQVVIGSVPAHHPQSRFPASTRKGRISDDQARLLKKYRAPRATRDTVGALREACRKLDIVGLAIGETIAEYLEDGNDGGAGDPKIILSLLRSVYSELAAPPEETQLKNHDPRHQ
ncbi:hypothetical protein T484DRAFT_1747040 [Baffinella frigidus]|nr:hypothetical protein T484DRAFT_1747040 [Cryptophyta sp. CCMP2293]